jgi:WD40 repeat protein
MLRLPPRLSRVFTLAVSPDNRFLLAVGFADRLGGLLRFSRVALWDLAAPTATPELHLDAGLDPVAGFFLPDGRALGVDNQGNWRACRPGGADAASAPAAPVGRVHPVGVSADGRRLALVGRDVFRCAPLTPDGRPWEARFPRSGEGIEAIGAAFSPDGSEVAVGVTRADGRPAVAAAVTVHDAATGAVIRSLPGWSGAVHRLAWSPGGRHVVAASESGFRVFAVRTREVVARRESWASPLTALAVHPSGRWLVTADGPAVRFWDAGGWGEEPLTRRLYNSPGRQNRGLGELLEEEVGRPADRSLDWGAGVIQALAFSPDGTLGAVAGAAGEVVVWDVDA